MLVFKDLILMNSYISFNVCEMCSGETAVVISVTLQLFGTKKDVIFTVNVGTYYI